MLTGPHQPLSRRQVRPRVTGLPRRREPPPVPVQLKGCGVPGARVQPQTQADVLPADPVPGQVVARDERPPGERQRQPRQRGRYQRPDAVPQHQERPSGSESEERQPAKPGATPLAPGGDATGAEEHDCHQRSGRS